MKFTDIEIVDLDLSKTTWSRVHSSMRTLYLRLTREPETGWVRFFHEERESRIVVKRHGLWIEDGYIVFDCLLDDVEEHHLPDFRLSVEYANAKYREFLTARREAGEQMRDDVRAEEEALAALRARIRGEHGASAAPVPPRSAAAAHNASRIASLAAKAAQLSRAASASLAPLAPAKPTNPARADVAHADTDASLALAAAPALTNCEAAAPLALPGVTTQRGAPEAPAAADAAASAPDEAPTTHAAATGKPEAPAAERMPETAQAAHVEVAPAPAGTPEPVETGSVDVADFNAKREEWRARFRAALTSRPKEPARGND